MPSRTVLIVALLLSICAVSYGQQLQPEAKILSQAESPIEITEFSADYAAKLKDKTGKP